MQAMSPEDVCHLLQHSVAEGDIDSVLSLYDPEAVFVNHAGEVIKGKDGLRQELMPLVAEKARFDFGIKQVVQTGDIALMDTQRTMSGPQPMRVYAIEFARRQADGNWRWLIGDPYTVGGPLVPEIAGGARRSL